MPYEFSQASIERVVNKQYVINMLNQAKHMSASQVEKQLSTPPLAAPRSKEPVYCIGDAAKMLGVGRNTLFGLLRAKHILEQNNHNTPYQRYLTAGYFKSQLKSRQTDVGTKFYAKTHVTNKGLIWLQTKIKQWQGK